MASPDYLASKPSPSQPSDLEEWDWIRFAMRPDKAELISSQGKAVSVTGQSHVSVNSADALYEFAARGLGVSAIPEHLACRGFDRGDLVPVLPQWSLKPLSIYSIWPDQSRRENLTMIFVRFLSKEASYTESLDCSAIEGRHAAAFVAPALRTKLPFASCDR